MATKGSTSAQTRGIEAEVRTKRMTQPVNPKKVHLGARLGFGIRSVFGIRTVWSISAFGYSATIRFFSAEII